MNNYLETGIAVVLILFVFSVVAYVIQELIAVNLRYRAKMLKYALEQLMDGNGSAKVLSEALFDHPQLKKLKDSNKKQRLPSYVPATNFASAIIAIVAEKSGGRTADEWADFKNGLDVLRQSNEDLYQLLSSLSITSGNIEQLQAAIEKWFNEYMDRVSGWYKNKYRWVTRIIAICIALAFNLDMIRIVETVHNDPVLRGQLVSSAEKLIDHGDVVKSYYTSKIDSVFKRVDLKYDLILKDTATKKLNIDSLKKAKEVEKYLVFKQYNVEQTQFVASLIKDVSSDKLIFAWTENPFKKGYGILTVILGLFLGAIGISMGAPFWFEMMMKFVNVRRAGPKPKENNG